MSINKDKEDRNEIKNEKDVNDHLIRDENSDISNIENLSFPDKDILSDVNAIIDNYLEENLDKNTFQETGERGDLIEEDKLKRDYETKLKSLEEKVDEYKVKYQKLEDIAQKYEDRNINLLETRKEYEEEIKKLEKRNQELVDSKEEFARRSEQLQEGREHFLELSKQLEIKKAEIEKIEKKLLKEQRLLEKSKYEIEKNRIDLEKEKLEFDIDKSELKLKLDEGAVENYADLTKDREIPAKREKTLTGKAEILETILKKLANDGSFQSCFLIDGKGMLVSEYGHVDLNSMAIGAMFSLICTNALRTIKSLSLQELNYFKLSSIDGDFLVKDINLTNYPRNFILLTYYDGKAPLPAKNKQKMSKRVINRTFKDMKEDFYKFGSGSRLSWVFENFSEKINLLKQKYTLPETDSEIKRLKLLNKTSIEIKELFES